MHARVRQAYVDNQFENSVTMARPVDLVVMVYQRILEHADMARSKILEGADPEESIRKALDLIQVGLVACLDREAGGKIASNLEVLYDWGSRQLLLARLKRDSKFLDDFTRVFLSLADAWRLSVERLSVRE